jgi:VanZ family protein
LVAGWAVIIFVLSSIPGDSIPHVAALRYDKVVHALVYAVLGGLVFVALSYHSSLSKRRLVALAAVLALGYGLSDEFHQLFVRNRSADLYDAMADGIGGLVGAALAALVPLARPGAA